MLQYSGAANRFRRRSSSSWMEICHIPINKCTHPGGCAESHEAQISTALSYVYVLLMYNLRQLGLARTWNISFNTRNSKHNYSKKILGFLLIFAESNLCTESTGLIQDECLAMLTGAGMLEKIYYITTQKVLHT